MGTCYTRCAGCPGCAFHHDNADMHRDMDTRPAVTADAVVLAPNDTSFRVLLVQRRHEPYAGRWALPGGFVGIDEDLLTAAGRELAEETGLTGLSLTQLGAFDRPNRDPRGRIITVAYYAVSAHPPAPHAGSDAAAVRWFDVDNLPPLAFDHAEIIAAALARCQK